jgi:hypothetical protein
MRIDMLRQWVGALLAVSFVVGMTPPHTVVAATTYRFRRLDHAGDRSTDATPATRLVRFYPRSWPQSDVDISALIGGNEIEDVLRFIANRFDATPQVAFASSENHSPVDAFLFYGLGICDDQARVAHHLFTALGRESRILPLEGHVALEVKQDGRWIYVDPHFGGYVKMSLEELREIDVQASFLFHDVVRGVTCEVDRTQYPFSMIGSSADATEVSPMHMFPYIFLLLPGDEVSVQRLLPIWLTPYRITDAYLASQNSYGELTIERKFGRQDPFDGLRQNILSEYGTVHHSSIDQRFSFSGPNSSVSVYWRSPAPLLGVTLKWHDLQSSDGHFMCRVTNIDTDATIATAEIQPNDGKLDIPFPTLVASSNARAIRNIEVTLSLIGGDRSSGYVADPAVVLHGQITPVAVGLFRREFGDRPVTIGSHTIASR